jgi:hypothetical protein
LPTTRGKPCGSRSLGQRCGANEEDEEEEG